MEDELLRREDFTEPISVTAVMDRELHKVALEIYDTLVIHGKTRVTYEEFLGACLCTEIEHLARLSGFLEVCKK